MLDAYAQAGGNVVRHREQLPGWCERVDTRRVVGRAAAINSSFRPSTRRRATRLIPMRQGTIARTFACPSRRVCGGYSPSTSTSIGCICGMPALRSTRPFARSTTPCADGKVLYIGISDAPAWVVARANTLAELRGWTAFAGLQVPYSLLQRDIERELLPMAEAFGMTVAAWSPLAGRCVVGEVHATRRRRSRHAPFRGIAQRSRPRGSARRARGRDGDWSERVTSRDRVDNGAVEGGCTRSSERVASINCSTTSARSTARSLPMQ